jgi:predicted RNase H-like nuclease
MSDITWSDIDFGSRRIPKTEEERRMGIPDVSPEVTNIEIQEFAIEHFPEGPAAAIEPQKAWLAYKQSTAAEKAALPLKKQLFFQSKQPMPEAAKRWDALVADWCRRFFDLWLSQQRSLAHVDFGKGINLTPQRQQEPAQGSWRDRRSPVDKEPSLSPSRERKAR